MNNTQLKNHIRQFYTQEGLQTIERKFLALLKAEDFQLYTALISARINKLSKKEETRLIFAIAPFLETFIANLFLIENHVICVKEKHHKLSAIFRVKRHFIQRYAIKKYPDISQLDGMGLWQNFSQLILAHFKDTQQIDELAIAELILLWHQEENNKALELAAKFAAWAVLSPEGQLLNRGSLLFKLPNKADFDNLLQIQKDGSLLTRVCSTNLRNRVGFNLTDRGFTRAQAADQAYYCIKCHVQEKDSCSIGLKNKSNQNEFQINTLENQLIGCPLEQKISEMMHLKSNGYVIGALAAIMIDNPLVAVTGHRICNDCEKACIFQKQEPVNIPSTETQILNEVLNLPWGVEIYSLLSRWNPLNFSRPVPKLPTNKNVLVVGSGPAGCALAHHLLNEGHSVTMIDGLKIEPLSAQILQEPIEKYEHIYQTLEERQAKGFGGVAEYGITVRWDKNYLSIIRLLLERRQGFKLIGGVRLGSQLNIEDAIDFGFHHIALCIGAGSPRIPKLKNAHADGIHLASSFLMTLHQAGAALLDNLSLFLITPPIVVMGGGLTAIDAATEALAYYPRLVEKIGQFWQTTNNTKQKEIKESLTLEQRDKLENILKQYDTILKEKQYAQQHNKLPDFSRLVQGWGGVTVIYHRELNKSAAYRTNHKELQHALDEGITIIENANPIQFISDKNNHIKGIEVQTREGLKVIPAKTVLIATGVNRNTSINVDESNLFYNERIQFIDESGHFIIPSENPKANSAFFIKHERFNNPVVSVFGDFHPTYAGSIVKAMASAKYGYPYISKLLNSLPPKQINWRNLSQQLSSTVQSLSRLSCGGINLCIKAPLAAQKYSPGQFFRLQNFHSNTLISTGKILTRDSLALSPVQINKETGTISFYVNSYYPGLADLKVGQPISLMGPTGTALKLSSNTNLLMITPERFSSNLELLAGKAKEIGANIIHVELGDVLDEFKSRFQTLSLDKVNQLLVLGPVNFIRIVQEFYARHLDLQLHPTHTAMALIYTPMQCMMKGICGQCIQQHIDPITQDQTWVFSCNNIIQPLASINLDHLNSRQKSDKLTNTLIKVWKNQINSN